MRNIEAAEALFFCPRDNSIERETKVARHQPLINNVDPANPSRCVVQIGRTRRRDVIAHQP